MSGHDSGRIKQVILIRKDLGMRRGKEVAQGAHAAMAFLVDRLRGFASDAAGRSIPLSPVERAWIDGGMAKVCVRVDSEDALLDRYRRAREAGLEAHLVRDSGRTEFGGVPTLTACAIGPDNAARVDTITGDLVPY
jgi:PTH2 family peptidyl-tRNA hydrolase